MRLAIIGSGYVGLVSGVCLAEFGHTVTCVDRDAVKVAQLQAGRVPIFEPGLEDLLARNAIAGRITFTTDLAAAVPEADVVFIAVGTPEGKDGMPDVSHALAVARDLAAHLSGYTVIVNKSTVPVGFGGDVVAAICESNSNLAVGTNFDVCSNPEFLREGAAIGDFMRPDRVVIGIDRQSTGAARAEAVMREIYRPLVLHETPLIVTDRQTGELTKYAGNAFLATKIAFINEIANLCEAVGADVQDVARGIGLDSRIGQKFLAAGPGYGGSCFPKDTTALAAIGHRHGQPQTIVEQVIGANNARKQAMAARILAALDGKQDVPKGAKVAILGLTFKPLTNDMREAASLSIIPVLQAAGITVAAYDPEGMDAAADLLPGVTFAADAYTAAENADALVILTEWSAFRLLDLVQLRTAMRTPRLLDLRNIYSPEAARAAGFTYQSLGRP